MAVSRFLSPIAAAFEQICRDSPNRPLVYLPASDRVITALQLTEAAREIRAALDAAGVNPRGLIVTAIGNRIGYLATVLACLEHGQTLLPLDSGTSAAEISAASRRFGGSAILLASAQPLEGYGRLATLPHGLILALPDQDPGDTRHGAVALLKMTSGSSGAPRATLTSEDVLISDTRNLVSAMDVGANDVQIGAIPLSHAYGIGNIVVPLFTQGTAIVLRDAFVPQRLPDDARQFHARVFAGVPFMFDHFAKNPPPDGWPPTLTNLLSAGARLEVDAAEQFRRLFGVKIRPFYGTSETGGITFDGTDAPAADGMVGSALPGVSITLMPHEGAPEGGGRVLVRGPAVIEGYADGDDPDSFVDGGFLTGDLGVFDTAGQLMLSGRVSSFVNVAGRKVQPDEVERILRLMDGISDVRVIGMADERRGEQLVACLVVSGKRPSLMALRQFCGSHLASHKIPRSFVFLDAIPLTERGKTDRIRLREAASASLQAAAGML
jgi:long-chain acyl-CoA synthetase